MSEVGLRELRQQASELVRRVEAGEQITITVSGRPAARLVPMERPQWLPWESFQDLFTGRGDPDWEQDMDLLDRSLRDPWEEN